MTINRLLTAVVAITLFAPLAIASSQTRPCENIEEIVQSLQFPREALQLAMEGSAVVAFTINSDGVPVDVQATSSSNRLFEPPAIAAVQKLRCDKQRAGTRLSLPIYFYLTPAGQSPTAQLPETKANRTPRIGDQLLYRRTVTAASGMTRSTLVRVMAFSGSESYPTWFSYTGGGPLPPGAKPIWEPGLRLSTRACVPDVLGNAWLWDADDCRSISFGSHWSPRTSSGTSARCEVIADEFVQVPAGRFNARRILCTWLAPDLNGKRSHEYWYSMEVGYMIRVLRKTIDASDLVREIVDEELEMLTIK